MPFRTRRDEAAFSSAEDLEAAMRESVQELSESMELNPLARVKLARQVFAFGNQALPRARKYAADQRLNWANGQDRASIELNQEAFLNNADDSDARMLNLNTMRESYERYAARNGLSEEEKTLGWKKIQSGAYSRLADKYISEGNLSAARRLAGEEALWMDGEQSRLRAKITRQEDILRAQAEAQRQEEEREAVRSLRQEILDETAAFPTLEEQQAAALARAESLEDPKLREKVRAGIVREMDWSIRRRDAEIMRTGLEFRRAAREEGLSPEEQLARLKEMDMPPYVRAPLEAELESGTQRLPNEENMTRAMTLLRLIDASRAGGMSSAGGSSPSREDILAAALYGGLTDGQTEGVLAYLEKGNWLPISRLDDICLELGMAPDKRGQVLAPAWLYAGVLRETAQSGNSLSDEELKKITTRVWQRHDARIAAEGGDIRKARGNVLLFQYRKAKELERTRFLRQMREQGESVLAAYRKNPQHYDEGARYYQVLRRPLEGSPEFILDIMPDTDNNARLEHQHFWGDNGDNFGFMAENKSIFKADGVVRSDDGHTLDEYKKDIPGLGTRKFKGVYIRMARDMLQEHYRIYSLPLHNCQDYIDDVITVAGILAEENNDNLEFTE